jgi:hypothetical protein
VMTSRKERSIDRDSMVKHAKLSKPSERPARYQEWLEFYFGRLQDGQDPWQFEWEFEASPLELADLYTTTFTNSASDLVSFSDWSLSTGLEALLVHNLSNMPFELTKKELGSDKKLAFVRSLGFLYRDFLTKRVPPFLGHLNEGAGNRLNSITYMLWDSTPLSGLIAVRDPSSRKSALIEMLREVLLMRNPNPACLEGVLHGLGHMVHAYVNYRSDVISAIDDFIANGRMPRAELLQYAIHAKTGMIQ